MRPYCDAYFTNERVDTCGDIKHMICRSCFWELKTNQCPMCKKKNIVTLEREDEDSDDPF